MSSSPADARTPMRKPESEQRRREGVSSASSAASPPHVNQPSPSPPQSRTSAHSDDGSDHSHETIEKEETRSGRRAGGEPNEEGYDSYSSYYDYESYEEDEDEGDEEGDGTEEIDNDSSRAGSPPPPPQEDLLRFLSFTIDDEALKDHRLMTLEAFRQILLIGTNQGAVAVVDAATGKVKELLHNHREPISDVDCTTNELFVAASDKAGYLSIQSRRDAKDLWITQLGMPIESVALHPIYHKLDSRPVVCGGGTKVLLLTKGMLWSNSRRVTTLQEERGRVHCVRWCHRPCIDILAWLTDTELTVYDVKGEAVLQRVVLPRDIPQNALYPPTLRWERPSFATAAALSAAAAASATLTTGHNDSDAPESGGNSAVLLCGWGDMVQEVRVFSGARRGNGGGTATPPAEAATRSSTTTSGGSASLQPSTRASTAGFALPSALAVPAGMSLPGRPVYSVELRTPELLRPSRTLFPYRVCGIAPYGPQRYVVLASIIEPGAEGVMKDLEVRVVERDSLTDVYRGRMPVRFIHPLQLHLTYLEPSLSQLTAASPVACSSTDPLLSPSALTQYFLLSVDAIVKAMPADFDDHVGFLMRTNQFEQAYHYALQHRRQLRRHVLQQVGHQWLLYLFERRQTDPKALLRIVDLLPELVPQHNSLAWEQWIYRLDTCGESWRLVALLPGRGCTSAEFIAAAYDSDASAASLSVATTVQAPIRKEYYDLVLLRCLQHDPNLFYAALHKFHTLFTVSVVLKAAEAAYRQHCSSIAWWSATEEEEEEHAPKRHTGNNGSGGAGAGGERAASPASDPEGDAAAATAAEVRTPSPTAPSAKQPRKEEEKADGAAPTAAHHKGGDEESSAPLSRTERWSLAASYGYLLRCAGRYEEAMQTLMHLPASPRSDRELFSLVREERLFRKALELLPELLQRREEATLELLLEHVSPPSRNASLRHFGNNDDSTSSPTATSSSALSPRRLGTSQFGSPEDPLNLESVVERLERSDRLHLLRYLDLVKEVHPKRFVQAAKRHAQLLATLYIEYDRATLLPFLKQMSMYVERIRELHALCHKYHYLEEEIFLLFRMGREDEALRILIEKMHDIHRALDFVVSVPDHEEQTALFARLVDYTVVYNGSLPRLRRGSDEDEESDDDGRSSPLPTSLNGLRYVLHQTQPGETFASIARKYHVPEETVIQANGAATRSLSRASTTRNSSGASSPRKGSPRGVYAKTGSGLDVATPVPSPSPPPPPRCVVPLNLFGALLDALADPQFSEHPALDVRQVLHKLPTNEPIPHAGASIAAIAHTMAEETAFLSTVSEVGERDLMGYYAQLLKRRTAALVVGGPSELSNGRRAALPVSSPSPPAQGSGQKPRAVVRTAAAAATVSPSGTAPSPLVHRCAACHQLVSKDVIVFGCQHMYHPECVLQYMRNASNEEDGDNAGGTVRSVEAATDGLSRSAAQGGQRKAEEALRQLPVYCRACRDHTGEQS